MSFLTPTLHKFIRNIVSDGKALLATLDAQIGSLVRLREETAECVHQHPAVISPVRRMLPELIGEMFALAWLSKDDGTETTLKVAPWHLGHICRSWRHTALSYTTQLMQLKNAPFGVFWRDDEEEYVRRTPSVESIDGHLLEVIPAQCQCGRCGALHLECRFYSSLDWLFPAIGGLDPLRKLDIVNDLEIPDAFPNAPALRREIILKSI
ncbi:hypothetical protein B0H19DRAFT_1253326 [Mycena capillaripes]|nr:hypothetical protein B0H19DRAFT_1253326 [Mycena capillaripes]